MTAVITVFEASPDRGEGQARDMRVRWAFEEVGVPYDVRLMSFDALKQPGHRALQPFGQIPTLEDGAVAMFESGAIVLHIALRNPGLLPEDETGRANAFAWMFAALGTIEPPIVEQEAAEYTEQDQSWYDARTPLLDDRIRRRLGELSHWLGNAEWLDGAFSAGDLMMVTVLRRLEGSALLAEHANLVAYVERGKARPAFQRAFAAQHAVFEASQRP